MTRRSFFGNVMHLLQNIGTYQRIVFANQQTNSSLRLAHAPVDAYDEM